MNTNTLSFVAYIPRQINKAGSFFLLCLFLGFSSLMSCGQTPPATTEINKDIRLNQIGFYPDGPKLAVIKDAPPDGFFLCRSSDQEIVFRGQLSDTAYWPYANEIVRRADFSAFQTAGEYYLDIPGKGRSALFRIDPRVHKPLTRAALKSFYYFRCSTPLEPQWAAPWDHSLGHPDKVVFVHKSAASVSRPAGSRIAAPGGWYDAGDYGKYTPTATYTTWALLSLYELFPQYYDELRLDIPESGNNRADVLDEALWSLRFLLKMQEPLEGFVYHKLTTEKHARKVMPEDDLRPRYVIGKSTAASLSFAAVMAQASRVYAVDLPAFADSCLSAARLAWKWSRVHPQVAFMENPEGIFTGICKDEYFVDDFNWAATELYITTGEDSFYHSCNLPTRLRQLPSRRNVHALPFMILTAFPERLTATGDQQKIEAVLLNLADRYKDYTLNESAYRTPLGIRRQDFNWGSNAYAAGMGMVLARAWQISGDISYRDAAFGALDYILGRNALGYCFVTGMGSRSPLFISHRPSEADGVAAPVPGLMVGGPQNLARNDTRNGKCVYPSELPALRYLDDWCSYTTNEVAINWNASFVYLLGILEAEMQE